MNQTKTLDSCGHMLWGRHGTSIPHIRLHVTWPTRVNTDVKHAWITRRAMWGPDWPSGWFRIHSLVQRHVGRHSLKLCSHVGRSWPPAISAVSGRFHGRVGGRGRPVTDRWCSICFSLFTQNQAGHAVEHNVPGCNDSSNDSNMEPMSAGYDSYMLHNFKVNSGSAGKTAEPQSGLHPDYKPL